MFKISSNTESVLWTIGSVAAVAVLNYVSLHIDSFGLSSFWVTVLGIVVKEAITDIEAKEPAATPTTPAAPSA
jgi:hypothetical protein